MREARTLLAQKIRERRQTFEEFTEYAEQFAREHDEPGTLSARHLRRLATGSGPNGSPPGPVRPATARLLERIFDLSINQLLAPPPADIDDGAIELRRMLHAARSVDNSTLSVLGNQLANARLLDRRLGAVVAHDEVQTKARQVTALLDHCVTGDIRRRLAGVVSELSTLAGWQALDLGNTTTAWRWYEQAKSAALASESVAYHAYAQGEQAFVLLDIGDIATAVDVINAVRDRAGLECPRHVRAWLAAARGEALAAAGDRNGCLHAFDNAARLQPSTHADNGPYVALHGTHLDRWRGHALAAFGDAGAITVLHDALDQHDPTFVRAEAALRTDLATAFTMTERYEDATAEAARAWRLATDIGSTRQRRRLHRATPFRVANETFPAAPATHDRT